MLVPCSSHLIPTKPSWPSKSEPENAIKFLRCKTATFAVFAAALIVSCGGSSSETSNDASELANSSEIGELVIDEDAAGAPSGDGTLSIPSTSESLDVSSDLDSEEEDTATADELTDEERALCSRNACVMRALKIGQIRQRIQTEVSTCRVAGLLA